MRAAGQDAEPKAAAAVKAAAGAEPNPADAGAADRDGNRMKVITGRSLQGILRLFGIRRSGNLKPGAVQRTMWAMKEQPNVLSNKA
ncbi:hypothetical protein PAJ34TS1_62470 [Paenibacillus azoreducens]|uniref:Uncharacterized protein n=1 Tax=Paenibacillus azoreducens TaxID=116718 RepID=A0A920CV98_9BACL|nr:hypothetical protein J34TS1_50570 [Paenibacillus azoreducens]